MDKNEDSASPGWRESFFMQTRKDASTVSSPRPSIMFSPKDDTGSQLQKLRQQLSRVLKGFSPPPEVKSGAYNPEVLTSQKRQWAHQLQDHRSVREPPRLFESMVVVGLHPSFDVQVFQKKLLMRKFEIVLILCSQVLFVYPPEKRLPLKYKDLLSFCFPGGLEAHGVERTPSMSELNEILLGQDHLKQSDLSFVFRLQVADDSTLYGCCVLVEEIVQKPPALLSILSEEQPVLSSLTRHIITAPRCYCILSRLPFFDLHFGVLKSIFAEERLRRLTKGIDMLNLVPSENYVEDDINGTSDSSENKDSVSDASIFSSVSPGRTSNNGAQVENQVPEGDETKDCTTFQVKSEDGHATGKEPVMASQDLCSPSLDEVSRNKTTDSLFPEAILSLLQYYQLERSKSFTSLSDCPCEDGSSSDVHVELEKPSSFGHGDSNVHNDILGWAKTNDHGALQIISAYYQLHCPVRGSTLRFHPLEHLHPLEYQRPGETVLQVAGATIDIRSCVTSLELAEAHNALLAEEEATALSVWTVACICANLRLENVLMMFAGALLEKQIVVVCSNLGILSAVVLSVVSLIRPYQWQSLLMPVLPNGMLDFLDAPVPYIVGIKNRTSEVQSKLSNVILIDANKNQVKSHSMPHLPGQKDLLSSLSPYHAKLVGESYLASKRPVYECTDVQVEAAKGFLAVLRSYLDSLCSNLRSHTITNVSLLLKESFIDSFPARDQPFMKLFVDTQLFSVHTDFVLSFYQKD
ncbi:unnamed protein product [Spirodela intermedia]|uniref:UDENN domain-containing protein n=1 Tax=Spirodela intermedia TaxID=51605 RepID=A0A7I8IQP7_SPIIN|nr:unnamed protein product [Spirodela intermedia]CAA6659330.1 unnamed protein product [Spirodela intermedia]